MNILADIIAARQMGLVHAHCVPRNERDLETLLGEFGLFPNVSALRSIERELAQRIAALILSHDLAYGTQLMSAAKASQLASGFMALFGNSVIDCFTNASLVADDGQLAVNEWTSLTDSTFDAGIIVLSNERAGCLWVRDED